MEDFKTCPVCYKQFINPGGAKARQICCSEECSLTRYRAKARENKAKRRAEMKLKGSVKNPSDKKEKPISLAELSKKAREMGMTYGEYIARTEGGMR